MRRALLLSGLIPDRTAVPSTSPPLQKRAKGSLYLPRSVYSLVHVISLGSAGIFVGETAFFGGREIALKTIKLLLRVWQVKLVTRDGIIRRVCQGVFQGAV